MSYKRIVNEVNVNNNLPLMTGGLKMSCHFCSLITKFFIVYFERFLKGYIRKNHSFEHDFVLKNKLKLDIKTASS